MSILKIVEWPAKVLETKAAEVTKFDDSLKKFADDMHQTMQSANGIGLAANQVGSLQRIIAIEIPYSENRYEDSQSEKEWWHDKKFTLVNPVITKKAGKVSAQEGCLSFPEVFEFVDRAREVWVKAQDVTGKEFEIHATGLLAICIQHEIDHIDGVVFINRMSRLKAQLVRKRLLKRQSQQLAEV